MKAQLLKAKFYIPPSRPELVPRPRLRERLNGGLHHKLTLVSAPAGFGKTTVVGDWVRSLAESSADQSPMFVEQVCAAWLSLDENDNDPNLFFTYFTTAIQQVLPDIGQMLLERLQAAQPPAFTALLTTFINDMDALSSKLVLVLDDYHVIQNAAVHAAINFLLDHLPPQIHLMMIARSEPPLSLARLRARGQMGEIRVDDLRFTSEEAIPFLNHALGFNLSMEETATLESRTEGWIAGLQLAAIAIKSYRASQPHSLTQSPLSTSTQDDQNVSDFIATFAGDDHYIVDYLMEEVLHQLPESPQTFLLQTSILNRMCGPLCNAVTGRDDGQTMLESLEQANLFVVPLDNKRQWYRYHHLFADMLVSRLSQNSSAVVPDTDGKDEQGLCDLHRRASRWYEQEGLVSEAIEHAIRARDYENVAQLIEAKTTEIVWVRGNVYILKEWLDALPEDIVRSRPQLSLTYAGLLFEFYADQTEAIEARLHDVVLALSKRPDAKLAVSLAIIQANLARRRGDSSTAIELCSRALDQLPAGNPARKCGLHHVLAATYDSIGELSQASIHYQESVSTGRVLGDRYLTLLSLARLIEVSVIRGQLQKANNLFQQVLKYFDKQNGPDKGMAYLGMGEVLRERNDLENAETYLSEGIELCRPFDNWLPNMLKGMVNLAWVQQARGEREGALALFEEMQQFGDDSTIPYPATRVAASLARLWLTQGNVTAAARWAQESNLNIKQAGDNYLNELDYLAVARILIAQARSDDALTILAQLFYSAKAGDRMGRVLEVKLLQALAYQTKGDLPQALNCLTQALAQAEPEGYIRLFVDEGEPMATLLRQATSQGIATAYVERLLSAFLRLQKEAQANIQKPEIHALLDPLTSSELKTLKYLATDLPVPQIAEEMVVTVSTVRTYTKHIYSKLNVHSRIEATHRAKELGLLD
ncbi:LuxR C-terminal-related transcriptional regulator [Chloroflexi bacterium TSY]|nr:LuxR C-terminal-related transcriptional regulator [Chloroflexi bacterium TSY]